MDSKPCERSGCSNLILARLWTPSQYARRRFCSVPCAAIVRYATTGFIPKTTHAQSVESGRKGGLRAGENKRRRAAQRVADHLAAYITPEMREGMSSRDLALWKALLARAWRDGHTVGKCAARKQSEAA